MKAIIFATDQAPELNDLTQNQPSPLLPVLDRPFIQHIVEYLVERGFTDFEIVLNHMPEKIESLLGDGTRWGSQIRYHLTRTIETPYNLLKVLSFPDEEGPYLLAHADMLPHVDLMALRPDSQTSVRCIDVVPDKGSDQQIWSGWAWVSGRVLAHVPIDMKRNELGQHLVLQESVLMPPVKTDSYLALQDPETLVESQLKMFSGEGPDLLLRHREQEEGVWLSRNVSLHPTARIRPPVYIAENCKIGPHAEIGPNVSVGSNSMLDGGCVLSNAVVFSGSYVGEGLEVQDGIVDRNQLFSLRLGTSVTLAEDFILGNLSEGRFKVWWGNQMNRLLAGLMLIICSPILVMTAVCLKLFRKGPVFYSQNVISLPARSERDLKQTFSLLSFVSPSDLKTRTKWTGLQDFLMRFLPGLISVVAGHLRTVGVESLTPTALSSMDNSWKSLYIKTHGGLISESFVYFGKNPTSDERYAAESYYHVKAGFWHNLQLLAKYFVCILNPFFNKA